MSKTVDNGCRSSLLWYKETQLSHVVLSALCTNIRSSYSNQRTLLSHFYSLKMNSGLQFHIFTMGYRAQFQNKIPFFSQILQINHARLLIPFLCSSSSSSSLFYWNVTEELSFLKTKTLNGLAQANWNYGKLFVKLNCKNIAKTIKFCVRVINRVYPTRAGLCLCCLGLFQVLSII